MFLVNFCGIMYPNWTLYFSDVNMCASFYCFISFETNGE